MHWSLFSCTRAEQSGKGEFPMTLLLYRPVIVQSINPTFYIIFTYLEQIFACCSFKHCYVWFAVRKQCYKDEQCFDLTQAYTSHTSTAHLYSLKAVWSTTHKCACNRDLKHLCHTQTDLKGNNLRVMAAPPQPASVKRTQMRSREVPRGTPAGSDFGSSPSFNLSDFIQSEDCWKGSRTSAWRAHAQLEPLQTRQEHLGSRSFHHVFIFFSLGCLG